MVTDSFHGTVFAIIFNKPFVALGNARRGMARFHSLLATFGLEDRLLSAETAPASLHAKLREPVDWEKTNAIREREAMRGIRFLRENLPQP
ncbi:MAG: polysaccharide pyruvyl transferase family protein [Puniceicoccales bacterium]|jgi:hypothetical protein|nr:polysaccharide pyruvyl transferase family protein [Puniceicoccales bacterium]